MEEGPNRLFSSYLERLRNKCAARKDLRSVALYDRALESLRRYPLPLRSVSEARKLIGIGDRVAADLQQCLDLYGGADAQLLAQTKKGRKRETKHAPEHDTRAENAARKTLTVSQPQQQSEATVQQKRPKVAVAASAPQVAEVIDVELERERELDALLARIAPPPKNTNVRSVSEVSNDGNEENEYAEEMDPDILELLQEDEQDDDEEDEGSNKGDAGGADEMVDVALEVREPFLWRPGDRVHLVVDHRELARKRGQKLRDALNAVGLEPMSMQLTLGDMGWIVQRADGSRLLCRHLVERKTVADLSASIKDGRYREQKHRLKRADLKSTVYLIEGPLHNSLVHKKAPYALLPPETLEAAIASTAVGSSQFIVQRTRDVHHTARYLAVYTKHLEQLVQEQVGHVDVQQCPVFNFSVDVFNKRNKKDKNMRAKDVFALQLLCVAGVSAKKAAAVVAAYPTLACLMKAYAQCATEKDRRAMLENLELPQSNRRLGPKASTVIAKAFSTVNKAELK